MKLMPLFEEDTLKLLRKQAFILQQEFLDNLHPIVDNVELQIAPARPNLYEHGISLKLEGPLVEFYIDMVYSSGTGTDDNVSLHIRTDSDEISDSTIALYSKIQKLDWFSYKRIMLTIYNANQTLTDESRRYHLLWFDKIVKALPLTYVPEYVYKPAVWCRASYAE